MTGIPVAAPGCWIPRSLGLSPPGCRSKVVWLYGRQGLEPLITAVISGDQSHPAPRRNWSRRPPGQYAASCSSAISLGGWNIMTSSRSGSTPTAVAVWRIQCR